MRGVVGVELQIRFAPGKCSLWQRERRLGEASCQLRFAGNEVKGWCLARAVHPTNRGTPSLTGYLHERDLRLFQTLPLPKRVSCTCTTEIHRYAPQRLDHKRHNLHTAPIPQSSAAYATLQISDSNVRKVMSTNNQARFYWAKLERATAIFKEGKPEGARDVFLQLANEFECPREVHTTHTG